MNIVVFGASGATGRHVVGQALQAGHTVVAFCRNPAKLNLVHERLTSIQGDVSDFGAVERAVRGADAVLSALGVGRPLKPDPTVVEGVRNIVTAMEKTDRRKFVYLSTNAVAENRQDAGFLIRNIVAKIARHEISDHEKKEEIVKKSSIDWIIVRAPGLTNGAGSGSVKSGVDIRPSSILPMMPRADVAAFMLSQLTDARYIRKPVRIFR